MLQPLLIINWMTSKRAVVFDTSNHYRFTLLEEMKTEVNYTIVVLPWEFENDPKSGPKVHFLSYLDSVMHMCLLIINGLFFQSFKLMTNFILLYGSFGNYHWFSFVLKLLNVFFSWFVFFKLKKETVCRPYRFNLIITEVLFKLWPAHTMLNMDAQI